MTTEENLKELIISRYGTMREFATQINMSQSTLATILTRGVHNASIGNILKICKALRISADELANDNIVSTDTEFKRFVSPEITEMLSYMRSERVPMTIRGRPLTDAEWNLLLDGLEIIIGIIERRRE